MDRTVYISNVEWWLREWRININVSKSAVMIFEKAGRHIPKPRPVQILGEPIHCTDTTRYLGVNLNSWLTWSTQINQVRKKQAQRLGMLGLLLNRRVVSPSEMEYCCINSSYVPWWTMRAPSGGLLFTPMSGNCRCSNPSVLTFLLMHLGTMVTGKFTSIWKFHSLPTTSH